MCVGVLRAVVMHVLQVVLQDCQEPRGTEKQIGLEARYENIKNQRAGGGEKGRGGERRGYWSRGARDDGRVDRRV